MLMLVDHTLQVGLFDPCEWQLMGHAGASREWAIFRKEGCGGHWAKGRRAGDLFHIQSVQQVWELYIQAGRMPPAQLQADVQMFNAMKAKPTEDHVAVKESLDTQAEAGRKRAKK